MRAAQTFRTALASLALLLLALSSSTPAQAQPRQPQQAVPNVTVSHAPQALELAVGRSIIVNSDQDIRRISLAAPDTADVLLLSPRQVYLTGKAPGATNLTLWGAGEAVMAIFDLDVSPDQTQLKRMLASVLPNERGIRVVSSGKTILLTGSVSSAPSLATALSLAETFAPGKVQNLLSVGGVQQVMLEVRVAEMSRNVLQRLGIDFNLLAGGNIVQSLLGQFTTEASDGKISPTKSVGAIVKPNLGGGNILNAYIDALKENGLVKVLAEPNLICISGKSASFLAGGEIPIPIPQALGTVAIEYKPFGVGLNFTPMVLDSGRISIQVNPEVSELDYSLGVTINSWQIPGLTTRRASTTVELASGQSFAIAGLIKDSTRESIKKFPGLGDLPVLGALFRSSEFRKNETELVIIVTPHLVKPLDMAKQTLPTDGFKEPTPYEFFVTGQLEGKPGAARPSQTSPSQASPLSQTPGQGREGRPTGSAGFDGPFGAALPAGE
ncbi:MAG: type II and III secretion system protein family protein [Proteobacteria bacterium]|nr:type II and III secretion system protein family protein [Pseudomonadota bacterium]